MSKSTSSSVSGSSNVSAVETGSVPDAVGTSVAGTPQTPVIPKDLQTAILNEVSGLGELLRQGFERDVTKERLAKFSESKAVRKDLYAAADEQLAAWHKSKGTLDDLPKVYHLTKGEVWGAAAAAAAVTVATGVVCFKAGQNNERRKAAR